MEKDEQFFTRKEVAEIFSIKPRTLWHWEKKGWIKPAFHIGNRPRYSIEAIESITINKLGKK